MAGHATDDSRSELLDLRRAVLNLLEDLEEDRQRLTRAEREWRATFDSVRDAMFTHDGRYRILRANRAYLDLAGCGLDEAVGRPYWEVFPRVPGPLFGEVPDERGLESELRVAERLFRNRAFVVRDETGRFAYSVHLLEDVTERRLSQQELEHRSEELAAANRALKNSLAELRKAELGLVRSERLAAIGTLASSVAHELNNPLMGVMNYVAYGREKSCDAAAAEALDKAARELGRMAGFVRDLLLFGRAKGEELAPVRVEEAVARALDLVGADLRKRKVQVALRLAELPPVMASSGALEQVFLNLFINAADAMAASPQRRLAVDGAVEGERVRVMVSDTGSGVAKEHEASLFEPFFTTKPEGQGTGLGLPVSRRIMIGLGGALDYLPRPGPGATFALTLRAAAK